MDKSFFAEQIKWYFSLSYILKNDYQRAIPLLQDIKNKKGYYSNNAIEILSKIK